MRECFYLTKCFERFKTKNMKNYKEIGGVIILALFFGLSAYLAHQYSEVLSSLTLLQGGWGIALYVFLGILATVVAPVSTLPLLPIAVALWGPLPTAMLSIFAWGVGAVIAFALARSLGKPFVAKYLNIGEINKWESALGRKGTFWTIILLRMLVPVDLLSYAIGLFSSVNYKVYTLATFIGITPFAFVFSYTSTAGWNVQIVIFIALAAVVAIGVVYVQKYLNKEK